MRKFLNSYGCYIVITLFVSFCYLSGIIHERDKLLKYEIENFKRILKQDEKIWMYVQGNLKTNKNILSTINEIRNKIYWGNEECYFSSKKNDIYIINTEKNDIEERKNVKILSNLNADVNVGTNGNLIQIVFPFVVEGQKFFLVFNHTSLNSYLIEKKYNDHELQYEFKLRKQYWAFIQENSVSLILLALLTFILIFVVRNGYKSWYFRRIYVLYKKRVLSKLLLEKELQKIKFTSHSLREGNANKLSALTSYSSNYLLMYEKALELLKEFSQKHKDFPVQHKKILLFDVFREKHSDLYEVLAECMKYLKSDFSEKGVQIDVEKRSDTGVFYNDHMFLSSFFILLFSHLRNSDNQQNTAHISLSLSIMNNNELHIFLTGNFFVDLLAISIGKNISFEKKKVGSFEILQIVITSPFNSGEHKKLNSEIDKNLDYKNVIKLFKD